MRFTLLFLLTACTDPTVEVETKVEGESMVLEVHAAAGASVSVALEGENVDNTVGEGGVARVELPIGEREPGEVAFDVSVEVPGLLGTTPVQRSTTLTVPAKPELDRLACTKGATAVTVAKRKSLCDLKDGAVRFRIRTVPAATSVLFAGSSVVSDREGWVELSLPVDVVPTDLSFQQGMWDPERPLRPVQTLVMPEMSGELVIGQTRTSAIPWTVQPGVDKATLAEQDPQSLALPGKTGFLYISLGGAMLVTKETQHVVDVGRVARARAVETGKMRSCGTYTDVKGTVHLKRVDMHIDVYTADGLQESVVFKGQMDCPTMVSKFGIQKEDGKSVMISRTDMDAVKAWLKAQE